MTEGAEFTPEEIESIQGMPPDVAAGFLAAKRRAESDPMRKVQDLLENMAAKAKDGNPVHDARIDEFNQILLDELKDRRGT